ncbi:hypothetical protein [Shewanella sp. Arc9-LZ]|uniref:hypothetical protein n=1 Tax=Shewanella sp. Arc9-LZ TaxID=2698686 RepID=UPI0020C24633|nr:hypothetical protein [Shewanella sp. Arc9-LZ]|tara:strand:+ start:7325 stop:7975 length:651 start_codon:yes stop_codon:yes gene_type:complete
MTQLSDNSLIEKKEKWVIEKTGEKYHFTRWLGDQVHESYAPVSQEVAGIYAAAIVQGFQPPHCLYYLDKLTSCNQADSELNKQNTPMCEVKFKHDLACFYGFTALDNFSRSQVGRIIDVLKREPELLEVKADRLEAIAGKIVSKVLLGDSNTLLLPQVSVDWFMGYLLMQEKRAERSIEETRIDPVNQAKHIKRRDIYYQLRTNLARDIYVESRNE